MCYTISWCRKAMLHNTTHQSLPKECVQVMHSRLAQHVTAALHLPLAALVRGQVLLGKGSGVA